MLSPLGSDLQTQGRPQLQTCPLSLEGLRTCWILCITHVPVALPFMYDRMNSIWLISLGNLDPCRHMYRLHSTLKQSRSSCRPVNGVGAAIFGSLVVVG